MSWLLLTAALAGSSAVPGLQARYTTEGAATFSASRGAAAWKVTRVDPKTGESRACTTCHGADLRKPGKHAKTGEFIDPMLGGDRLTDPAFVEKWFTRNCSWTYGRACTPQEKGDFLAFLTAGGAS